MLQSDFASFLGSVKDCRNCLRRHQAEWMEGHLVTTEAAHRDDEDVDIARQECSVVPDLESDLGRELRKDCELAVDCVVERWGRRSRSWPGTHAENF